MTISRTLLGTEYKIENLLLLASRGDPEAQYALGEHYFNSSHDRDVTNSVRALAYFQLAACQGHLASIHKFAHLGKYFFKKKDFLPCCNGPEVNFLELAVDAGNAEAQYYMGKYRTRYISDSMYYYRKAAEQNHAKAQYKLARCYYDYDDEKNSIKYFKLAADQGCDDALHDLKDCYKKSLGVPDTLEEKVQYYRDASDLGFAHASYALAQIYEKNNMKNALQYYTLAATRGHKKSCQKLYQLCANGIRDKNSDKVNGLGICYLHGFQVIKDKKKAAKCFRMANDLGSIEAKANLKALYDGGGLKNFLFGKETAVIYLNAMINKTSESISALEKEILKDKKSDALVEVSLEDSLEDIAGLKISQHSIFLFKNYRNSYIKKAVNQINTVLCEDVSQVVCSYLIKEEIPYIAAACKNKKI